MNCRGGCKILDKGLEWKETYGDPKKLDDGIMPTGILTLGEV